MFKISVIIPTFNRKQFLSNAINSVLDQTYPNIELIIIDDGSSDKTIDQLKKYKSQIKVHKQPNKGISAARNKGLKISKNDWVAFLDSDDRWEPEKLEKQVNYLKQNPKHKFCHTDEIWIKNTVRVNPRNKHKKYGGYIFDKCLDICCISPSSVLIHKSIFKKIGLFDENLPVCEDYDLWLRIAMRYRFHFIEQPLVIKYGGHEDQLSRKYWGMDRFRVAALKKLLDLNLLEGEHFET